VPSLPRLRELANTYGALLIVDDTIGSFANIDLLGPHGVDILITSLTKSFSGYADVMGGSAVLNPLGARYAELKSLYTTNYTLEYSALDAATLASNSRDYLARSAKLNYNTQTLVNYFLAKSRDPKSPIKSVRHPTTNAEFKANYDAVKRPNTDEFETGYGYLFSIEFKDVEMLKAFYDVLNMHMGPHLGAHRTIVITYVKALYGNDLGWAGESGLQEACKLFSPFVFVDWG
jgi:cystathionine gamma-synthase